MKKCERLLVCSFLGFLSIIYLIYKHNIPKNIVKRGNSNIVTQYNMTVKTTCIVRCFVYLFVCSHVLRFVYSYVRMFVHVCSYVRDYVASEIILKFFLPESWIVISLPRWFSAAMASPWLAQMIMTCISGEQDPRKTSEHRARVGTRPILKETIGDIREIPAEAWVSAALIVWSCLLGENTSVC